MNTLLFIYNANSGIGNTILGIGHKLLNPKIYQCNLCALTHHTFSEDKSWKKFRNNSKIEMLFFHSDEFEKAF